MVLKALVLLRVWTYILVLACVRGRYGHRNPQNRVFIPSNFRPRANKRVALQRYVAPAQIAKCAWESR